VKVHLVIGFLSILITGKALAFNQIQILPEEGVLDLSETVIDEHTLVSLNGEWEFYWERLLTPDSYQQSPGEAIMVEVPSYWQSYLLNGKQLPGKGYGTYALKLILPEDFQSTLCFDIPVFDVAYKLYINQLEVERNGVVGTNREEEEPWYDPSSFCYVPENDTLQILVQVSNFHHRRGGFWKTIYAGGSERILLRMERRSMYNYSTIGILFFFTLFFFIFWTFTRREILMLLFALTALGILIRSVNTGLYFSNSFIDTPWTWQIRMEYLGTYMAHIFGMMFLHKVFPTRYMRWPIRINTALFSLAILSIFLLPVHLFSFGMFLFQPVLILILAHYLIISLVGSIRGRVMDVIFFVSMAFFLYTLINDILLANSAGAIYSNYFSQISFQLFIFAMAVLIILQWVKNYKERFKLESSLRFKNLVLSVVAHDLKNPVASIAQFSDLLVTKPELAGKDHFTRSLQESAQAAVTLLDNLLYWGRSQSDKLMISPAPFNVKELVGEVHALYAHMALQKEIEFESDAPDQLEAYADRALVNIVVRNLISNAIKFTPRSGKVGLRVTRQGNMVQFEVSDSGMGMEREVLESLKKFGELDSSLGTDQEIGTGLGLQLATDLVEKNGGVMHVDSTPGAGSVFTFTIPLKE
jgi:signal transduction histidine kinase